VTWVTPSSGMNAPAEVASPAKTGSSAARSPPKMNTSATRRSGNAIRFARIRSFRLSVMLSSMAPASPPTLTCAPGTASAARVRIEPTAVAWPIMPVFLASETTIRLACPSRARSCGFELV